MADEDVQPRLLAPLGVLGSLACVAVIYGSYRAMWLKERERLKKEKMSAQMSQREAYKLPIVGSLMLLGLFLAFRFLPKVLVNVLVSIYVLGISIAAFHGVFKCFFENVASRLAISPGTTFSLSFLQRLPLSEWLPYSTTFSMIDIVVVGVGMILGIVYAVGKNWVLNDFFGFVFSIYTIEMLTIGKFTIGATMLGGLFFYDIFWVFKTPVMVNVAVNLDAPVKLVFPKAYNPLRFAMLGLGDIIIPGIFIAFILRFEKHLVSVKGQSGKGYFCTVCGAYVVGMGIAMGVMVFFGHAQPVLLYLVPACLGSVFLLSAFKNDLSHLLSYSEEEEKEKKK